MIDSGLILTCLLSGLCFVFWLFFFRIETIQLRKEGVGYFQDYWNLIDILSFVINILFLLGLNIELYSINTLGRLISHDLIRTIGAIGCWFMWIKLFYWMRLFKNTAYFLTLIS